jgi:hypothetical protein
VDQTSAGHFDISDQLGARLILLGRMCEDGNGYAAWVAYRLCRLAGRALPEWLMSYFDRAARFLLDEYERDPTASRQVELGLGLGKPRTARGEADGNLSPRLQMQRVASAVLPGLVDDFAKEHGVTIQAAIKQLAPVLGYAGEHQWTRLRDAYKRSAVSA